VECGQRPPVLIDTSRPAEDSRQRTNEKLRQRLVYLHENPVRSGLVWETCHYKYSSAIDYYTTERGLLKIEHL
jgi:hypothetical protein